MYTLIILRYSRKFVLSMQLTLSYWS